MSGELVAAFPTPPKLIDEAFQALRQAASGDRRTLTRLGPLANVERPWDPPTCRPSTRNALWLWLDEVVAWLNHDYVRQPDQIVPSCWPRHPELVHEIALLASQRFLAGRAFTLDPLTAWHRESLPGFFTRMADRLGGAPCHPGHHKPWAAESRYTHYLSTQASRERAEAFSSDPCV